MYKNNEIKKLSIIENILILGLKSEELNKIQNSNITDIEENLSKYKSSILSNYSLYNKISPGQNDDFYTKICEYSFPDGVIISSENISFNKKEYITFTIKDSNNHLKHITCACIQSGLKINDGNIIIINNGVALVSFLDIYECHKEILSHIIDIISNYFNMNSSNNKKFREILCGNKIYEEYRLIPFYFSFILNLTLDKYNNLDDIKNICLMNISNNYFQNVLCKISLNPKNKDSILSLKEYDTSILLEKFYIEDIIKLYYALLLDKSIIFLFNDYSEIDIIINSLLSITFPLDKNKKYNIKYIYNKSELQSKKLIRKDQLNIIYLIYYTEDDDLSFLPEEGNTPSFISTKNTNINNNDNNISENSFYNSCLNFYYYKDTFVYSLKEKKFLNCPFDMDKNNKIVFVDEEINDEIKSLLYFTMGEKLVINSDMNFDETDLGLIFDNSICNKINTFLYLNLKIKAIFFRGFLMILNGINSLINFNYKFNKLNFSIAEFFDVKNKFVKANKLKHNLIKNKNFQEFLVTYIKKYKNNEKYMFIYKIFNDIENKNFVEMNKYLNNVFKEHIRNGIINYYNFDYINLEKCFKDFLNLFENNKKNNNKDVINDYLLNSSTNFSLYQLLNIDIKKIEKFDSFFKKHSYYDYLEKDISYLNKFQLYKIYNSVKIETKIGLSNLYLLKTSSSKIASNNNNILNDNNLVLNRVENNQSEKAKNTKNKVNIIPNIDSFFGKILKVEVFPKPKKELINNNKDKKIEIAPESKKLNFKKINKDLSPPQKSKESSAVGRNSSYYNCFNFPLIKNTNQFNKRKNLQLSNGKELKKNTQSFREKNIFAKSKNKIIKGNVFIETDNQINNFRERSSIRKYTYNLEESNTTIKKFGLNKNNKINGNVINNNIINSNKRIRKDIAKKIKNGPNNSSKKYENNFGHIPKLAGDLDDDIISDEDSNK